MCKQRTLSEAVFFEGKGLHGGKESKLTVLPAPEDVGFRFRRMDLKEPVEIEANFKLVSEVLRSTSLKKGQVVIHTVEHILSALSGCGVDNAFLELEGEELPILDGSAKDYANGITQAGLKKQKKERTYLKVTQAVAVSRQGSTIVALPFEGFRISCTSKDQRAIHTHYADYLIEAESYPEQIAPARTFVIYEDIKPLLQAHKIQGANLDTAIVLAEDKIISKNAMRFDNEMARHKILDLIGDLSLLGKPLKTHVLAVCPSHSLNVELCRTLIEENALQ